MSNIFSNTIGRKLIMSITGLFLVLFLIFHATMNIVVVFSPEGYNAICEFLGANWYALAGTMVLAGGFLLHILYAIWLTLNNRTARGKERYAMTSTHAKVSWASKNMFILGVVIIGFAALHLWQFWAKMQLVEIMGEHQNSLGLSPVDGAGLIQYYFSNPIFVVCYLLWLVALWFHLTHGFWSAFQTIGWNNQMWLPRLECIGKWFATIVCAMFAVVVVAIYLQTIMCSGSCPAV